MPRQARYPASGWGFSPEWPRRLLRSTAASQRALLLRIYSYQSLKSILKHSLDRQPMLDLESERTGPKHDNIRGAEYYQQPPNLFLQ